MKLNDFSQLKQFVSEAELVLVGLGQEWIPEHKELLADMKERTPVVAQLYELAAAQEEYNDLILLFVAYYDRVYSLPALREGYEALYELVHEKNYFILSLGTDSFLKKLQFKQDRFVNPCGTYDLLQCNVCCEDDLFPAEEVYGALYALLDQLAEKKEPLEPSEARDTMKMLKEKLSAIKCKKCQEKIVFNTLDAVKYNENGYLDKWQIYMKWLQGTVNKRLCVIEAGVGLELPSVIRWPFEKTVFYNQKAKLNRIHHRFYQVNEEISERAYSMEKNSVDFFGGR